MRLCFPLVKYVHTIYVRMYRCVHICMYVVCKWCVCTWKPSTDPSQSNQDTSALPKLELSHSSPCSNTKYGIGVRVLLRMELVSQNNPLPCSLLFVLFVSCSWRLIIAKSDRSLPRYINRNAITMQLPPFDSLRLFKMPVAFLCCSTRRSLSTDLVLVLRDRMYNVLTACTLGQLPS